MERSLDKSCDLPILEAAVQQVRPHAGQALNIVQWAPVAFSVLSLGFSLQPQVIQANHSYILYTVCEKTAIYVFFLKNY